MALTRRTTLLLVSSAFASSSAQAQPVKIRLGTATPGGGFPVYGEAFAAALTSPSVLHPGVLAYYRQAGLRP